MNKKIVVKVLVLVLILGLIVPIKSVPGAPPFVTKKEYSDLVPLINDLKNYSETIPLEARSAHPLMVAVMSGIKGRSLFGVDVFLGRYSVHTVTYLSKEDSIGTEAEDRRWLTKNDASKISALLKQQNP